MQPVMMPTMLLRVSSKSAKDTGLEVLVGDAGTFVVGEGVPSLAVVVGSKPTGQRRTTIVWLGKAAVSPGIMNDTRFSAISFGKDWMGATAGIQCSSSKVKSWGP